MQITTYKGANNDGMELANNLIATAAIYGRPVPTPDDIKRWVTVLDGEDYRFLTPAFREHTKTCKFFPKPQEIVVLIRKFAAEDAAKGREMTLKAADAVFNEIQRKIVDSSYDIYFADPKAATAFRKVYTGLYNFFDTKEELTWQRKHFVDAYVKLTPDEWRNEPGYFRGYSCPNKDRRHCVFVGDYRTCQRRAAEFCRANGMPMPIFPEYGTVRRKQVLPRPPLSPEDLKLKQDIDAAVKRHNGNALDALLDMLGQRRAI